LPVHYARIEAVGTDELAHSLERQWPKGNPANGTARRQHCQQAAQGMVETKLVVTVGDDNE
jgi:hypothetical protein